MFFAAAIPASAQVDPAPPGVAFQGALFEVDGVTPRTGPLDLEFRLYAAKGDTTPVWAESHTNVTLLEGVFSVVLGEGQFLTEGGGVGLPVVLPHDPLASVFTQASLWLGVTVAGETELPERQEISSVPYAFSANTAVTATHGVPAGTIAVWGGDIADIPVGWIPCDGASLPRADYPELFAAIGDRYGAADADHFNAPNYGGRALMGTVSPGQHAQNSDASDPRITEKPMGYLLGEEQHTLTSNEMPNHRHGYVV